MENVSTGVLEKIKNITQEVKITPKNDMIYQDIYNCVYQYTKKNADILSILSNVQPNCCLKVDFQKVDQHAGASAWLVHDTKRRKDNQLQSLKFPCRISKIIHEWIPPTLAVRECCDIFQDLLCYFELRHLDNRKLSQISKRNCDDKMNEKCLLMS